MSRKSWIGLGVGAAIALTVGGLYWALKGGPPASLATSSAPGPAASTSATAGDADRTRGPAQSSPDTGEKIADFFSRGLTVLDRAIGDS